MRKRMGPRTTTGTPGLGFRAMMPPMPRTRDGRQPAGTSRGTCFGFEIESRLSFEYLREAGEGPVLEVEEASLEGVRPQGDPVFEWITPEGRVAASLYGGGAEYLMRIGDLADYLIRPQERRISMTPTSRPALREVYLWDMPTILCFMAAGDLPLHASAVEVGDRAVLFAAPGRHGKSTLAGAFLRAGYRVLSEDMCRCRFGDGGIMVSPGPAILRIRKDVYERLEFPNTRVVADFPERVHLALTGPARGGGEILSIAGVVLLRESDVIRFETLPPAKALQEMWGLSYKLRIEADIVRAFEGIADLVAAVPVWDLYRPLSYESLDAVISAIVEICEKSP
jgi:hypothetical protein